MDAGMIRAVAAVALCATIVAGAGIIIPAPVGPDAPLLFKWWSGSLRSRFDGNGTCVTRDSEFSVSATLGLANVPGEDGSVLVWAVPSNVTFVRPFLEPEAAVFYNATLGALMTAGIGTQRQYFYKLGFEDSDLLIKYCVSASEAGFPADNDTAAVCSAERFCVEGRLSQASAVNPGGYCDAYCNMFMTSCADDGEEKYDAFAQCNQTCVATLLPKYNTEWLFGFEPDMVDANGTLFYDTIYCRLGQTFSATILGGSMACPAARLNSQMCVAPATLCDRICNNAQGPLFMKRCGATFQDRQACMNECASWQFDMAGPVAFAVNNRQCRYRASLALNQPYDPQMQMIEKMLDEAFCSPFLQPTGGVVCSTNLVANWTGTYQYVNGYCKQGTKPGQCCCNKGPSVVVPMSAELPNFLMIVDQEFGGGEPCFGLTKQSVPFMITSATQATAKMKVMNVDVTASLELGEGGNQIKFDISLFNGACPNYACKHKEHHCKPELEVDYSAAPRVTVASIFLISLLSVLAAFLRV